MKRIRIVVAVLFAACFFTFAQTQQVSQISAAGQTKAENRIRSLKIIVLSTMLAEPGIGEWGFAALVEVDGHRILFDTGARPDTVLKNARELGINLADVPEVILSHNHRDHTGGLVTLRREIAKENSTALARAHVGRGIFWNRPAQTAERNYMLAAKPEYEATGGTFIEYDKPIELYKGVWLTGPVPRMFPERNWNPTGMVKSPDGLIEDTMPEDMSMVFDTDKGLVVLSGCGHAGIINTLEYTRKQIRKAPVYAAIGGFHLYQLDESKLNWTADKLREFGLQHFLGAHCTGIEATYHLRQRVKLSRQTCVVSAVGSSFSLEKGIDPLTLAK
jgi:7,8-dihydropterin-6-yl-methyl-4-(beta-D-ribofuranosyl)aminobenzene 5'-phosphate synthase